MVIIIKQVCIIGILCLLTACSSSVKTTPESPPRTIAEAPSAAEPQPATQVSATPARKRYPLLPLPPGASYYGPKNIGGDLAVIEVDIVVNPDAPFTPEQYDTLFERYGWVQGATTCRGSGISTPMPTMTDTAALGVYTYGTSPDAPTVCLSKNMMVEGFGWMTLNIYHCGGLSKGDPEDTSPSDGCRIIVEEK